MGIIRDLLRTLVRFVIFWAVSALSLIVTAWALPGIDINPVADRSAWFVAVAAAFILGLVNLLIRPLILLLALPLGFIVLFVVGFFVNAIVLRLTASLVGDGLVVANWPAAILGGIALALLSALISAILGIEDTGAFYEGFIEWRLARQRDTAPENQTVGLVMLEIDGLSYHHIRKAIADGHMPYVKAMIEREGYVLSRTDCGLPSQTSACQSGILFGDNHDIPAFRWYDKAQGKLFVSGNDAAEINARYANGNGLLRGGASINNMMNGDAERSLLTASDLFGGTDEQKRARARDVYLLLLNPNFFMRVIGLFIGEAILEVWQYVRDVATDTQPRLNRLKHFYPFVRSATTVFMREVSGLLTIMQIVRGEPAIYTTWPGYDEVAHHSGPWSNYAFGTLRGYDRFIDSVRHIIETKAPRPYELIILSDHGQSFGATFKMRYGYTLKEFIEEHMPAGMVVAQTSGGDDGSLAVASTVAELGNVQAQGMGGRVGQAAARQMQRAAEGAAREKDKEHEEASAAADVTFCGSGNLAQVYFHNFGRRATLGELNAAFPGMVDAVVGHEGVGLVVGTDDSGAPIAFGKGGARDLHSGAVRGEDPLKPYGDVDLRAWQLRRLADFPSAGDLIIISAVYPDGSVAAMEELIGNHGGMGGEQTDSFLLHPADVVIPPTRNAVDLFAILNARRERPVPPKPVAATRRTRDDWAIGNLIAGLREVRDWVELALYTLILDRSAYRAIAAFGSMTGPALLLSLAGVFVNTLMAGPVTGAGQLAVRFIGDYAFWLLLVAFIHGAAHIMRGKGDFTQTFRALGFAQTVHLLELFRLIPIIDPLVVAAVTVLSLLVTWLAVAEAHRLRGWRTLVVPVVYLAIIALTGVWLLSLSGGLRFAVETLGQRFGFLP
jgi:uncharacterized membrane protein YvlD (DUF360 family)